MKKKILKIAKTSVIVFVCVVISLAIIFSTVTSIKYYELKPQSAEFQIYEEMNSLEYASIKYELAKEVDAYIKSVAPTSCLDGIIVIDNCLDYDLDICFVLAQGEIESRFGTAGMARKSNSVWNVFAADGSSYSDISKKGKYKSPNDSVEPYMQLMRSRFLIDNKTEYDMLTKFVDRNGKRYASTAGYEASLASKYNEIKTNTRIVELSDSLKRSSIILGY